MVKKTKNLNTQRDTSVKIFIKFTVHKRSLKLVKRFFQVKNFFQSVEAILQPKEYFFGISSTFASMNKKVTVSKNSKDPLGSPLEQLKDICQFAGL